MPIHPKNKHRYPANWEEIRDEILLRAGYQCEKCWKPHGRRVKVGDNGEWYDDLIHSWRDCDGHTFAQKMFDIKQVVPYFVPEEFIKVVLTIAHLDHIPEHNQPSNLRAWCQRCHLTYDMDHHIQQRYMNRRDPFTVDMFENSPWQVLSN